MGVPLLLRAFARARASAPAACLRIVGEGPQRGVLEDLASSLDLGASVSFRGFVRPDQVEQEMADAWAVVVPSLWAEPLGLVAVEAVVRGIPVVASASGGLRETVEPGASGLLFSNGNEEELVAQLEAILSGRAFPGHSLPGHVVARVAQRHDPALCTERLRGVLRSLADGSAPTTSARRPAPPG
jgi:glycosyltransferase involved in cell wall biosynthesis